MKRDSKKGWILNKKYLIRGVAGLMCLTTVLSSGGVSHLSNSIFKPVSVYAMSVDENDVTEINISNAEITNGQIIVNISANGVYRLTGSNLINDAYVDVILTVEKGVTADIILDGVTIKNNDALQIGYGTYSGGYTPFVVNGTANIYIKSSSSVYGYYSAFEVNGTLNFMESENNAELSVNTYKDDGAIEGDGWVNVLGGIISISNAGIRNIGSFVMEDGMLTVPCVTAGAITIRGGMLETTGDKETPGIGSESYSGVECRSIVISGGTVIAKAGNNFNPGIGASNGIKCGAIKITGGYVKAYGGPEYARSDIGASNQYEPDSVIIDGGFIVGEAWNPVNSAGETVYAYTLSELPESAAVSQIGTTVCKDVITSEEGTLTTYLAKKDVTILCGDRVYPYTYDSETDTFTKQDEKVACKVTFEDEDGTVIGTAGCESGKSVVLPVSEQYDYTFTYNDQPFTEETEVTGDITVKVSKELKKFTLSYVNGKTSEEVSYGTVLSDDYLYVNESNGVTVIPDSGITCDLTAYPLMVVDDVQYLAVGSEEELLGFRHLVNDFHKTKLNAKLTGNIECDEELLIGTNTKNCYRGMFDGQGYTLSKMTTALFGYNMGTICNVAVKDSTITSGGAAICALNKSAGRIKNCYNEAAVNSTFENCTAGICAWSEGTIQYCYNMGTITGSNKVGGIVGYCCRAGVQSCYNTGTVTGGEYANGEIVGKNDASDIDKCYYLSETETETVDGVAGKTALQFASGEVAYLLNGSTAEGNLAWGQVLVGDGKDDYPVFSDDVVYYGYENCLSTEKTYSNSKRYDMEHVLDYSADGNVITCNCAFGKEHGTIKLSASDTDYTGSPVTATVTNTVDETDYNSMVVYTAAEGSSLTDGLAVDSGTYTASLTVGEGEKAATASVTFTIGNPKIIEVAAPESSVLAEHYEDAAAVIATLPDTVTVKTEREPKGVAMAVTWSCDSYSTVPEAENTFAWTVKESEYEGYKVNNVAMSGSVVLTNAKAVAVEHAGTDRTVVYDGNTYDVSTLFTKDANVGEEVYSIMDGTGEGSLLGSTLTVTKEGTFVLKMTTKASGIYAPGEATATITVEKGENASDMPDQAISVEYSVETVGDVELPDNWAWTEDSKGTALIPDEAVNATAIYTGADAGLYKNTSVVVAITREVCVHDGETEVKDAKEATCGEKGYTGDTYCKDCGEKTAAGEPIAKKSHTYGEPAYNWSEDGKTCTVTFTCEKDETHTVSHEATVTSEVKTAATCKDKGTTTYTATYTDTDKKYSAEGKTYTATKDVEDIPVDETNHAGETEVKDAKEATCGAEGYTGDTYCKDCGEKTAAGEPLAKKSHTYGEPAYNWSEDGKTCTVTFTCEKDETHTVSHEATVTSEVKTAATCKDKGTTTYTATYTDTDKKYSAEGKTYTATKDVEDIPVDETAHTGGIATCKTKAECSACHETYGEPDKNNHTGETEVKDAKEATCGAEGYTGDTYCKDCGTKIATGTKIDKSTAHTWDNGVVTKEATANQKGEKTYTCSACKAAKTEDIPALGAPEVGEEIISEDKSATYKVTGAGENGNTVTYEAPTDKNATSVVVPATVTINNITYSVTSISDTAFAGNKKLTSVTIGDNVTGFSAKTFKGCTNLKTLVIGNGVTSIPANAFKNFKKLVTVKIGNGIKTIGKNAFYGCKKLKTVTIGKSVTKIDAKAFYGCSKLKNLTIKSTKLTTKKIGSKAFGKTPKSMTVKVPKKKLKAYKSMLIKRGVNKKARFQKI